MVSLTQHGFSSSGSSLSNRLHPIKTGAEAQRAAPVPNSGINDDEGETALLMLSCVGPVTKQQEVWKVYFLTY